MLVNGGRNVKNPVDIFFLPGFDEEHLTELLYTTYMQDVKSLRHNRFGRRTWTHHEEFAISCCIHQANSLRASLAGHLEFIPEPKVRLISSRQLPQGQVVREIPSLVITEIFDFRTTLRLVSGLPFSLRSAVGRK